VRRFVNRIRKLERRTFQQGPNRTLLFNPLTETADAVLVGKRPGRYLLAPSFGSNDEWERALLKQQRELIASNARTPKPPKREVEQASSLASEVAPRFKRRRFSTSNP
jgi:hypothetical protein